MLPNRSQDLHYDIDWNITQYQTTGQFEAFFGVSTTVCTVTILFYLLLIMILARKTNLLSGSSFLIIHQLTMEIQIIGIHFPIYIGGLHQAIYRKVRYTDEFCRHYMYAFMITVTAVQWGFFSLALNRFVAIHSPHNYKKWIAKKVLCAMGAGSWIIGIACYMYFYLGNEGSFVALVPYGECDFGHAGGPVFGIMAVISTYLPLFLTGVLYITLFVKVYLIGRNRQVATDKTQKDDVRLKAFKKRVRLARLLFTTTIVHTICFATIPVMYTAMPEKMQDQVIREWVRLAYFCAYVSTPVLYFTMNADAWNGLKSMLCGLGRRGVLRDDSHHGTAIDHSSSERSPDKSKSATTKEVVIMDS
ncbi:uncharacterized protein LOC129583471 [Paramacrobiotus metropolitanus]|uniref:uncharacterized protein LOC129583471 n=1 Tax=Paramacrobiotus metropolitanus TaxID=2943436 RepID=UPI0024457F5C|nr:uncharacterized protein LOC129583471 [Paramacrobiotus metropolitanus]